MLFKPACISYDLNQSARLSEYINTIGNLRFATNDTIIKKQTILTESIIVNEMITLITVTKLAQMLDSRDSLQEKKKKKSIQRYIYFSSY